MKNGGLAMLFIWKDRSAKSLGYIPINIVLIPLERHNSSAEILQYLLLVKNCHLLINNRSHNWSVHYVAKTRECSYSNLRPLYVTDVTHFAWIGLLLLLLHIDKMCMIILLLHIDKMCMIILLHIDKMCMLYRIDRYHLLIVGYLYVNHCCYII